MIPPGGKSSVCSKTISTNQKEDSIILKRIFFFFFFFEETYEVINHVAGGWRTIMGNDIPTAANPKELEDGTDIE